MFLLTLDIFFLREGGGQRGSVCGERDMAAQAGCEKGHELKFADAYVH